MSKQTWIKICCIASPEEAALALAAGANAVGLVSAMPSGPGPIPEARISAIAGELPTNMESVLLTSLLAPMEIQRQVRRCGCTALQLCDYLPLPELAEVRALLPELRLYPAVHVQDENDIDRATAFAVHADAILLDSGRPGSGRGELGGTGRRHDWQLSRRVVETCPKPVILAGGLNPENVAEAITMVKPWGVDVCSGLRRDGRLDEELLMRYLAAAREA